MSTMTIVVKVSPEKREEFLQAMHSLNNDQEKQQGLKKCALYQQIDGQTGFSLIYEWETRQDHEQYLGSEKFRVLLGALKVLCKESIISSDQLEWHVPR